jgi:hypothetical protein
MSGKGEKIGMEIQNKRNPEFEQYTNMQKKNDAKYKIQKSYLIKKRH